MKRCLLFCLLSAFSLAMVSTGWAMSLEYTSSHSGSRYSLNFTLANDAVGATENLEWFSVYFGTTADGLNFTNTGAFSNFSPDNIGSGTELQPTDWFSYSYESTAIDIPAQFNSDSDSPSLANIAPGDSLSGFSVSFDWTGAGTLDGLYFEVGNFDPANDDYDRLDDGFGTWLNPPGTGPSAVIPEPSTFLLLGAGLVGIFYVRKNKK